MGEVLVIVVKVEKSKALYMSACWFAVIMTIVLATFVVIKSIGSTARSWQEDTNESESNSPIDDDNATFTGTSKLRIISRPEWLAQPPIRPASNLTLPVPYVIIHHTATIGCPDRAKCIYQCRQIQTYHIESNGWWDIGYNFLVGGDGFAYKARGFTKEGAHTYGYNSRSICIAFIGTFDQFSPQKRQIRAAKQLISLAVEQGVLTSDFKILAARQLQGTVSPGKALFEIIKTWDHWAEKP